MNRNILKYKFDGVIFVVYAIKFDFNYLMIKKFDLRESFKDVLLFCLVKLFSS